MQWLCCENLYNLFKIKVTFYWVYEKHHRICHEIVTCHETQFCTKSRSRNMSPIKAQSKLWVGKANPAGEKRCDKQRAKSQLRSLFMFSLSFRMVSWYEYIWLLWTVLFIFYLLLDDSFIWGINYNLHVKYSVSKEYKLRKKARARGTFCLNQYSCKKTNFFQFFRIQG